MSASYAFISSSKCPCLYRRFYNNRQCKLKHAYLETKENAKAVKTLFFAVPHHTGLGTWISNWLSEDSPVAYGDLRISKQNLTIRAYDVGCGGVGVRSG